MKSLKILGQRFKVSFKDRLIDEEYGIIQGRMSSHDGTIDIRKSHPVLEMDTVIHEILHAIEYKMGIPHNEYWVNKVATGIAQVLTDNPTLIAYLQAKIKEGK